MTSSQQLANSVQPLVIPDDILAADRLTPPSQGGAEVVPVLGDSLQSQHGQFAEFHEGYVRNYVGLADTKAMWVFTIAAGAIAYVVGNEKVRAMFAINGEPSTILALATTAMLLMSAVFAFLVVAPRLNSSPGDGVVYFGAVAIRRSADDYVDSVAGMSESQLIAARLRHCYDVSGICAKKYWHLRISMVVGAPALVGLGALLLIA